MEMNSSTLEGQAVPALLVAPGCYSYYKPGDGTYPWSFVTCNGDTSHGGDRKTFEVMIST